MTTWSSYEAYPSLEMTEDARPPSTHLFARIRVEDGDIVGHIQALQKLLC